MLRLMNERDTIKVVNDQWGSPTWAFDLAVGVLDIIEEVNSGKDFPFGIYHYTNEGCISWFDFACEIYKIGREQGIIANECFISPCTSEEYPSKAKRPEYSVMNKEKIKKSLGIDIPEWRTSLVKYIQSIADS